MAAELLGLDSHLISPIRNFRVLSTAYNSQQESAFYFVERICQTQSILKMIGAVYCQWTSEEAKIMQLRNFI